MTGRALTPKQLRLARHALGLPNKRNRGTSGMPAVYSRREAYNRARIVIQRGWKFQAAERKRSKNNAKVL